MGFDIKQELENIYYPEMPEDKPNTVATKKIFRKVGKDLRYIVIQKLKGQVGDC